MGGMTEHRPKGAPPFYIRPTSPETQALYERQRRALAEAYRVQCELEKLKSAKPR